MGGGGGGELEGGVGVGGGGEEDRLLTCERGFSSSGLNFHDVFN